MELSCTNETQSLIFANRCGWGWPGKGLSHPATLAIRAICAALSAQMLPLAPLKVADITGGLDDLSGGFYYVKIRFRLKMANISGWMIYPVEDITEFYCIHNAKMVTSPHLLKNYDFLHNWLLDR